MQTGIYKTDKQQDLVWSIGNYIQYIAINCRKWIKNYIYIHMYACMHASSVAHLCPTLCDPMDCSSPGSSVHGIFQARIQKWVAFFSFRGSSQPRDRTRVSWTSCIGPSSWFLQSPEWPNSKYGGRKKCFSPLCVTKFSTYLYLAYKYHRQPARYCQAEWSSLQASF